MELEQVLALKFDNSRFDLGLISQFYTQYGHNFLLKYQLMERIDLTLLINSLPDTE